MVTIIKANGEKEEFSDEKLKQSIARAGVPKNLQDEAVTHVQSILENGISTKEIYQHISEFLETSPQPFHKTRYGLKQSIMDLGPTGYPFEKFIARLFDKLGYKTQTNQIITGTCITHEIDVVATKDNKKVMVEAKFHNATGIKTDVHVALYTKARFDDISTKHSFSVPMLVTNTKLTTDAIAYGLCVGMDIIGWNYPQENGLRTLVEKFHLHPITSLSSLSTSQKQLLLNQDIVLCQELSDKKEILATLGITQEKQATILQEASFVCSYQG